MKQVCGFIFITGLLLVQVHGQTSKQKKNIK